MNYNTQNLKENDQVIIRFKGEDILAKYLGISDRGAKVQLLHSPLYSEEMQYDEIEITFLNIKEVLVK